MRNDFGMFLFLFLLCLLLIIHIWKEKKKIHRKSKCKCVGVKIGEYTNQIWVHAPAHMTKENGYCLDRCIAEEVIQLWMEGITTTGCCCGHNLPGSSGIPYIGVAFKDINKMKKLGYIVCPNECRPGDEDSFYPKSIFHY